MAKFFVATAYHNIAVHLDDCYLLLMKWKGAHYVGNALPFGLHSTPFIFISVVDMVEWTLTHTHGVDFLSHYLDDFSYWDPPHLMFACPFSAALLYLDLTLTPRQIGRADHVLNNIGD